MPHNDEGGKDDVGEFLHLHWRPTFVILWLCLTSSHFCFIMITVIVVQAAISSRMFVWCSELVHMRPTLETGSSHVMNASQHLQDETLRTSQVRGHR